MMSARKSLSMTSGVLLVVFALQSFVSAQNDLEFSSLSDLESMEELRELLQSVQLIFEAKIASKIRDGTLMNEGEDNDDDIAVDPNIGCRCDRLRCTCCQRIRIKVLKVNDECCLSVEYLPRNYGVLIRLTFGRKTIFSKEISARNPPPVCVGVPGWSKGASVCIVLSNLNVNKRTFSGCATFKATLLFVTLLKINLGCFRINFLDEIQQIDGVQLPYLLGAAQALPEGPEPIYLGDVQMGETKSANYKMNRA